MRKACARVRAQDIYVQHSVRMCMCMHVANGEVGAMANLPCLCTSHFVYIVLFLFFFFVLERERKRSEKKTNIFSSLEMKAKKKHVLLLLFLLTEVPDLLHSCI